MKETNDFFIPDNRVERSEELDYAKAAEYVRSARAFARSTYQSVYIIDYFKQNFLYVSPNPMFLCGLSPQQMTDLGYRFYNEYVPGGNGRCFSISMPPDSVSIPAFRSISARSGPYHTISISSTTATAFS